MFAVFCLSISCTSYRMHSVISCSPSKVTYSQSDCFPKDNMLIYPIHYNIERSTQSIVHTQPEIELGVKLVFQLQERLIIVASLQIIYNWYVCHLYGLSSSPFPFRLGVLDTLLVLHKEELWSWVCMYYYRLTMTAFAHVHVGYMRFTLVPTPVSCSSILATLFMCLNLSACNRMPPNLHVHMWFSMLTSIQYHQCMPTRREKVGISWILLIMSTYQLESWAKLLPNHSSHYKIYYIQTCLPYISLACETTPTPFPAHNRYISHGPHCGPNTYLAFSMCIACMSLHGVVLRNMRIGLPVMVIHMVCCSLKYTNTYHRLTTTIPFLISIICVQNKERYIKGTRDMWCSYLEQV